MESTKDKIISHYTDRTRVSKICDAKAKRSLPGGDTRWSTYYLPYPIYIEKGEGCHLYDVDGNRYVDLQNNYSSLVHGHNHANILSVVSEQLRKDIISGGPVKVQYELAEIITERLPGFDKVRFTNSGTEATMMAMRTARAYTGRDIILKMDGGYHGTHDFAEVNITPDTSGKEFPARRIEKKGVPQCVLDAMMVVQFNDVDKCNAILSEHHQNIAAIIVEPVMNVAGIIAPAPGYLKGLRKLADQYGVLLIFDEIVTFRLSTGGMQKISGVIPDITTAGKFIGGGFPIGAFGGRDEIMKGYNYTAEEGFRQSGTFNGHNIAMAAGVAAMKLLDEEAIDHINNLGERLLHGIKDAFKTTGIKEQTTRVGSLLYVQWTEKPIRTAADVTSWKHKAADLPRLLHMELLNRGVFMTNRGFINLSTPMTVQDVDQVIREFHGALKTLKPYIEQSVPHLLI